MSSEKVIVLGDFGVAVDKDHVKAILTEVKDKLPQEQYNALRVLDYDVAIRIK
jgi:hypothetical protein